MRRHTFVLIAVFGVLLAIPAFVVVKVGAQQRIEAVLPAAVSSLATVRSVAITDDKGQVLLTGTFSTTSEDKDEIERTAMLAATGGADGGVAEIELERGGDTVTKEELEVSAKGLPPNAACKVTVDGEVARTFTASRKGEAELKLTRRR